MCHHENNENLDSSSCNFRSCYGFVFRSNCNNIKHASGTCNHRGFVASLSGDKEVPPVQTQATSPSQDNTTGEPTEESDIDSSAAVALITISKGSQGNAVISPQSTTIKTGGEILILNNDSVVHTIRNGMGPDDSLSGRMFGVGPIEPKGFIEYVASNLQPGTYPFYSTSDPSIKGELVVTN